MLLRSAVPCRSKFTCADGVLSGKTELLKKVPVAWSEVRRTRWEGEMRRAQQTFWLADLVGWGGVVLFAGRMFLQRSPAQ